VVPLPIDTPQTSVVPLHEKWPWTKSTQQGAPEPPQGTQHPVETSQPSPGWVHCVQLVQGVTHEEGLQAPAAQPNWQVESWLGYEHVPAAQVPGLR
jgi:hypothetical protein